MERRFAYAAAWVAAFASTPVAGQAPPTFPARTELVVVDVTVLDRAGRPQAGLGARDFRVTEDGRPQEIVSFEAVSADEAGETAASPSGVHRAEPTAGARFVLVFDDLHLEPIQTEPAGQAIRAFLERHVRAGDTLTLLAPGHGLAVLSRAGESRGPVVRALARLQGLKVVDPCQALSELEAMRIVVYGDEPMVPSVRRPSAFRERSPCPPGGTMDAYAIHADAQRRDTGLLKALRAALATTGETPERTSVVLLSGGFVDDPTLADRAQAVVRSSLRARASVYFVDVRGLAGFFEAEKAGGAIALGEEASGGERVAEDTGGFSVRNSNDLAAGLGRIAEGARTYYLLGYAPSSPGKPGRFRRIRVSVKTPGLTARARPGYYP